MLATNELALGERIGVYASARRRATEFLLAHMNADGSIGPAEERIFYYRVPWAFALSGETGPAMQVLEWIHRHMLTSEGEIRGISADRGMQRTANTYAETNVAYGAHLLRRYDVAQPTMRFALRNQDPETGGVFMDREQTDAEGRQLLYLTAQLGMSALLTGHLAAAQAAGQWMRRLWDAQPELPARLYTIQSRAGGLATVIPPDANRMHYVNESQEVRQYHYNGGIAAAFLTRLYLWTADPLTLQLARNFQRFSMETTEEQFSTKQVCKSAWGAGLLTVATGEAVYRDWTSRLADWFVAEQADDGSWVNTPYLSPNPMLADRIEVTAEFAVHLDTIIGALAASTAR